MQQTTVTDANGYWQFSLIPNPALTPTGTSYTIETPYNTYSISVPNSAGPFQSSSILVNAPSIISPALTGLTGPITVTGSETVTGNLTVQGTSNLDGTTTGALSATANSGVTGDWTILSPGRLVFTALAGKIVPGATSLSHRNNADTADNLVILDSGTATFRATAIAQGFQASGVGQFTTAGRFLGVLSVQGPPISGTYALGDNGFDSKGAQWYCSVAGSPGTWLYAGGGPYHAEVYLNNNQSITASTVTLINYDTIESDPNSNYSVSVHAYSAPLTGRYLVTGGVVYNTGSAGLVYQTVFVNGIDARRGLYSGTGNMNSVVAAVVRATAGQTIDLRATTGNNNTILAGITVTYGQFLYLGT